MDELAQGRYVSAYYAALIRARLGEAEAAMGRLEEAARERSGYLPFGLISNYGLLREIPGFRELMVRLGLGMLGAGTYSEPGANH